MTFSWADKTAPAEPAAQSQISSAYANWQRNKLLNGASGSFIYSEEYQAAINGQRATARQGLYTESRYGGLQSYAGGKTDPLDRRAGESTEGWRRRVLAVGRALDESELAGRLAAIDQADEQERPKTGEQLRAQLH